ncbi:MAG: hypothetical protein IID41_16535 [Planctomycetes bacterium]|nr:hypothetical protein [Planctomycetota bacterium]
MTTTTAETERAPGSSVQQTGKSAADPPEPTCGDSQKSSDILVCIDRLRTLCPEAFKEAKSGLDADGFWPAVLHTIEKQVAAKGHRLLADMLEFVEAWTPGESADAQDVTTDAGTDEDDPPKRERCALGEKMPVNHFFTGWAENVENVQAMLEAITCFTDEEDRFTKIDDQDCLAIEQMLRFVDRELDALVNRLKMAGDYNNPRVVTDGGYVWSMNTLATLTAKPADGEGGAS